MCNSWYPAFLSIASMARGSSVWSSLFFLKMPEVEVIVWSSSFCSVEHCWWLVNYDVHIWEILLPLLRGKTLHKFLTVFIIMPRWMLVINRERLCSSFRLVPAYQHSQKFDASQYSQKFNGAGAVWSGARSLEAAIFTGACDVSSLVMEHRLLLLRCI